jgi:TolB-like protein
MSADADIERAAARPTIFLSYARADRPRAGQVASALEAAGYDVWWDALIEGGAAFAKSIEAALDRADAVVVLWSKTSVVSDWVRDEAGRGRDLKRLVPVLLDEAQPPLGFRQYHAVDLRHWRGGTNSTEVQQIIQGIAAVGSAGAYAAPIAAVQPKASRRGLMLGAGAFALAGSGVFAWQRGLFGGGAVGNSIAVLPFSNLSGDPAQAYFSDGLSEELRATLARDARLKVMAQTSANQFRDRSEDITRIAAKLGVAFLLGGSVRRSGDVVRIAAELIDGKNGFSRWSQSFDRQLSDVFSIQSEIAGVVANALSASLFKGAKLPVKALGGTTNVAAYDAYLKGRALYNLNTGEETSKQALMHLKTAVTADPNFAMAFAVQAFALTDFASSFASADQLQQTYEAAIAAANRAIALAPDLADAHSALGNIRLYGKLDIKGARKSFDTSRALGMGDAQVMSRFALYAVLDNRYPEAKAAMSRALELDPLNPLIRRASGLLYLNARQFSLALPPLRQALAMNPKLRGAHAMIGRALLGLGQLTAAHEAFATESSKLGRLPGLAITEQALGNSNAAKTAMQLLIDELGDSALYQQAQVYARWGDSASALSALERAYAVGDAGLLDLQNDFLLDSLRREPRFIVLLKAMEFEPASAIK